MAEDDTSHFERAVLYAFDASGAVDAALKARATAYLDGLRAQRARVWADCAAAFESTRHDVVRFWCLQTLNQARARGALCG